MAVQQEYETDVKIIIKYSFNRNKILIWKLLSS